MNTPEYAFGEKSGQYKVALPSRHSLLPMLKTKIHEEAINAYRDNKKETENPYAKGCPAWLQWDHSFSEYKEACDAQDADEYEHA
jgi:hypothetical protein